jgi:hypothetical protein
MTGFAVGQTVKCVSLKTMAAQFHNLKIGEYLQVTDVSTDNKSETLLNLEKCGKQLSKAALFPCIDFEIVIHENND